MRVVNIEGCGFFPWIPAPADIFIPSFNPISLSLSDAMFAYWRVRLWHVAIDITFTDSTFADDESDPPIPPLVIHITGTIEAVQKRLSQLVQREHELTLRFAFIEAYSEVAAVEIREDEPPLQVEDWRFFAHIFESGVTTSGINTDPFGAWLPRIFFDLGGPGVSGIQSQDDGIGIVAGGITATFMGETVPMFNTSGPDASWIGTIDWTPIQYWPYANRDGSDPIYDAGGGALLDPLSYDGTP